MTFQSREGVFAARRGISEAFPFLVKDAFILG